MKRKLIGLLAMMIVALLAACSQPKEGQVDVSPAVTQESMQLTTEPVIEEAVETPELIPEVESSSVLEVEIAENGSRFSADDQPVFEDDGLPAYGNEFITEGYIYPAGTLTCTDNICNGVLPDGSPEFAGLVIGTWICRGWHIGDGAHTETGPWVATKQIYNLDDVAGAVMLVTDGFELSDFDVMASRAIIGGTGPYSNVRGQQNQTLLGWNESVGVALRVSFNLILDNVD